jgi:hypothetical protein
MLKLFTCLLFIVALNAQTCKLVVPSNPLTAAGVAESWVLKGCDQTDPNFSVFVEAVIFNNKTATFSIYPPLVTNYGVAPLIPTKKITLTADDHVGIWVGSNNNVQLIDNGSGSMKHGVCITGLGGNDTFGQVATCNAVSFFEVVNKAIASKRLVVPPLKTGKNGKKCYTSRSFEVVDQDPSDNVVTKYLSVGKGTAQMSAANIALLKNPQTLSNPSDNGLLDGFLLPALGCTPYSAIDHVSGVNRGAQALNEIQAALYQTAPQATIPAGDPMVLVNGNPNLIKLNLYRLNVNQPLTLNPHFGSSTFSFCKNMLSITLLGIINDQKYTAAFASPSPATSDSLFSFLVMRWFTAFGPNGLNCAQLLQLNTKVRVREEVFDMLPALGNETSSGPTNASTSSKSLFTVGTVIAIVVTVMLL